MGPAEGGTIVTITGTDFFESDEIRVILGDVMVTATYLSPTKVRFTTPVSKHIGLLKLDVAFNAQQGLSSYGGNALEFVVHATSTISSLRPHSGPINGGTS